MAEPCELTPILGNYIEKDQHYTIIGGGISGLLLGFFMKDAGISFEIREKSDRVGGMIATNACDYGSVETGANGILWCKEIDYVARKLDLKPLAPNQKDKKRFFVRNKKLNQFPLRVFETLGFLGRMLTPHSGKIKTVYDFGRQYMGESATRQILSPALAGIYGTSAEQLSFDGSLKMLSRMLSLSRWLPLAWFRNRKQNKTNNSVGLPKGLHSFRGGMQVLVDHLSEYLKDEIKLNTKVTSIDKERHIISTVPAHVILQMIPNGHLKDLLSQVRYQGLFSVSLFFKKGQFANFKPGFGCLIPREEGLVSLGVLFTSIIFPERVNDETVLNLRCILHYNERTAILSDEQLVDVLINDLDQLFGLSGKPLEHKIYGWEQGLPIYSPELNDLLPQLDQVLKESHPKLRIFGNYTGEISVRGACQTAFKAIKA
ncbi:MAG: protoporphyrinogen oxidase [Bacteroidia bacterium]|nr:protoporphyrinogen oxidase [Bacteroidia bacterium]